MLTIIILHAILLDSGGRFKYQEPRNTLALFNMLNCNDGDTQVTYDQAIFHWPALMDDAPRDRRCAGARPAWHLAARSSGTAARDQQLAQRAYGTACVHAQRNGDRPRGAGV